MHATQRLNTASTLRPHTAQSRHGRSMHSRAGTANSRVNTASELRPMTAVSSAGFISSRGRVRNYLND